VVTATNRGPVRAGEPTRADRVLAVLEAAGGALAVSVISVRSGLNDRRHTHQALSELADRGLVQRSKAGGSSAPAGHKERVWRVKPAQAVFRSALPVGDR
jgi:hypothetical protein